MVQGFTFSVPIMEGWSEQWYWNIPAVVIVMGVLVPPFPMSPVLNAPPFAVAVCVVPELLRHATVCPTYTVAGFGSQDMVVLLATMVIVTSAVTGGVIGLDLLPPQPARTKPATANKDAATQGTALRALFMSPPDGEPVGWLP